ncbi:hypothetical protein [Streptococcus suis]|uniref:hypothetical protein n=1 Tax=Streptococcus suis TaxID=1307 RepID=UPI000768F3E6|nr:hypothetical protein [Streptococcus suis]CYX45825.1 Uncharacterised protein [Streptococcus suis]
MTENRQLAEIAKIAGSIISEHSLRLAKLQSEYINTVYSAMKPAFERLEKNFRIINSTLSNIIRNIDFKGFLKQLAENEKRKLAYCLEYDVYIPPLLLNDVYVRARFENQAEADMVLLEHLNYWKNRYNKTVYDFIPLSIDTYYEINQLLQLEKLKYYKLMVIFCLERIEFIITEMQLQDARKLSKIKTSQAGVRTIVDSLQGKSDFLNNLVNEFSYTSEFHKDNYREINLFKRFDEVEDMYSRNEIPLNRNLFLHGLIKEEQVNYLMVQKAILAYAFFRQIYFLKNQSNLSKKYRVQQFQRIGNSRKRTVFKKDIKSNNRVYRPKCTSL